MYQLNEEDYQEFKRQWRLGYFGNQRYGQAFYDYFKLDKLSAVGACDKLYRDTATICSKCTAPDGISNHRRITCVPGQ